MVDCLRQSYMSNKYCKRHAQHFTRWGTHVIGEKKLTFDNKSIMRLVTNIYYNQHKTSKLRGHPKPEYSRIDLFNWIKSQDNFFDLYKTWIFSGYKRTLMPSVDRMDNNKGYFFNNIQLVSLAQNIGSNLREIVKNSRHHEKLRKKVFMVNDCGVVINHFISLTEASRNMGVKHQSIQSAIKSNRKCKGFKWSYKESLCS